MEKIEEYVPKAIQYYKEVEQYYCSLSLKKAVENAAKGLVPISCTGKRTSFADHQHRIGRDKCDEGAKEMLKRLDQLKKAKNFKEIFAITEEIRKLPSTERLGNLWSYDTAQRIAFKKGIKPTDVYLQTGAMKGARQLVKNGELDSKLIRAKRFVSKSVFPSYLSKHPAYIIENVLCVGKRHKWFE